MYFPFLYFLFSIPFFAYFILNNVQIHPKQQKAILIKKF
jgi:hypothetical protein